ncbi:StfH/YfcO family fimbrial adhesin [Escherichia coli]
MHKIRHVICLLVLALCASGIQAATKIATLYVPAGTTSVVAKYRFHLSVLTPQSVEYGTYESNSTAAASLPLVSWTGSPPGPELRMERNNTTLPDSTCPGLEEYDALSPVTAWSCNELVLGVYYDGDLHGCPWIVSSYVESASTMDQRFGAGIFIGPTKVSSDCPTESLAPYDVSWNENYVVHNKVVRLQSTGGVIEQTLPTFLMENGKLCDGSNFDERGAYCRFIAQQMTFSTSGCDNAKVTVTPEPQPITSRQLHDMKLRVDTTSRQPIDSTCRFTYILNMY